MVISCLYTTAREHLADEVKERFMNLALDPTDIEWVLVKASDGYDTCIKGWNECFKRSTGDILVQISDDLYPPPNWDMHIRQILKGLTNTIVSLPDERAEHAGSCVFHPIMTRDVAERNGFFYHPDYKSMFCDNWLAAYAQKYCTFLVGKGQFWHHKHRTTHAEVVVDEVMQKHESKERYQEGHKTFMKHLKEMGYEV